MTRGNVESKCIYGQNADNQSRFPRLNSPVLSVKGKRSGQKLVTSSAWRRSGRWPRTRVLFRWRSGSIMNGPSPRVSGSLPSRAPMPLVSFRDVSFGFGQRLTLHRFTLDVEAGEILVLLGRSGSGKTTALKTVNAMLLPTAGEVFVDVRATTAWDPIRLRRRIGYVIQDSGLFPHYTVA